MPRVLPWLKDEGKTKDRRQHRSAIKERRLELTDNLVDSNLDDASTGVIPRRDATRLRARSRSPSTSPPPAPPDVEYMVEGYNADDRWMMVEDEFATTAHLFTNHIHHAEYVRLKKLAKSKGEDALRNILHTTDGHTILSRSAEVQHQVAANAIQNDKILVVQNEGEFEGQPEPLRSDKTLSALMLQNSGRDNDLRNIARRKVNTRAAAGYSQSPHNRAEKKSKVQRDRGVMENDSDDLDDGSDHAYDNGSRKQDPSIPHKQQDPKRELRDTVRSGMSDDPQHFATPERKSSNRRGSGQTYSSYASTNGRDTMLRSHKHRLRSSPSPTNPSHMVKVEEQRVKEEPDVPVLEVLARRKARREKREKERRDKDKQKKSLDRFDDIPTFTI